VQQAGPEALAAVAVAVADFKGLAQGTLLNSSYTLYFQA
jgi:hypothetical protein